MYVSNLLQVGRSFDMSKNVTLSKDIVLLQSNKKALDVLLLIAKENQDVLAKLVEIKNRQDAMQPTDDENAFLVDNGIAKLQKCLKKAMMKEIFQPYLTKTNPLLKQLEIEVASRGFFKNVDKRQINSSDFVVENGVLREYKGTGGVIALPDNVEVVGEKVFSQNGNITSFIANEGLSKISANAFEVCNNLQNVELSSSIVSIEESAFYNCKLLVRVSIAEGLKSIGRYAFAKCPKLEEIYILDTLTDIGDKAFFLDNRLPKTIKKSVDKINKKALK